MKETFNLTATDTRGDNTPRVVFTGTESECLSVFQFKCAYSFRNHKTFSSVHYNIEKS